MSVVSQLHDAIATKNWDKVKEAYRTLGGTDMFADMVENIDTEDAKLLSAVFEGAGETPPKRKRGRPRKVKEEAPRKVKEEAPRIRGIRSNDVIYDDFASEPVEIVEQILQPQPFTLADIDQFKMVRGAPAVETPNGEKRAARLEPFQPPKGNKFDPKTREEKEPGYEKVNDNVPRIPRTRPAAETGKKVTCGDCGLEIFAPPTSGFCSSFGRCEYAAAGKKDRCPYTK